MCVRSPVLALVTLERTRAAYEHCWTVCRRCRDERLRLCALLQLELCAEHRLLDLGFDPAVGGIDERIRCAGLYSRILRCHVVLRRVIAERHVAGERSNDFERSIEFALDAWCHRRWRAIAASEHDVH